MLVASALLHCCSLGIPVPVSFPIKNCTGLQPLFAPSLLGCSNLEVLIRGALPGPQTDLCHVAQPFSCCQEG